MVRIITKMLSEGVIKKEDLQRLVKLRPPKDVNFANLVNEGIIELDVIEKFLVKTVKDGTINLRELEEIKGIDIVPIIKKMGEETKIKYIDLEDIEIDLKLFSDYPYKKLIEMNAIPVEENELNIEIVFGDPFDLGIIDKVQRMNIKKPVKICVSKSTDISKVLNRLETNENIKTITVEIRESLKRTRDFNEEEEESPAVLRLIEIILKSAIIMDGSDIHIEATEKNCNVRIRADGMLQNLFSFENDIFGPLSSRMKLLSSLDIAEKRKPQDGRFSYSVMNKPYDFRVSSLPTIHGESIVMRILDNSKAMIKLEDAGMSKFCYDKFSEAIKVPYGIVLVTGPTGSGKTTTLYGALNAIKDTKDKIITVEDPVEYQMTGLQQVNVKKDIGLGFADALRSILRQDPDKIMIGEIRDQETLRIAIQAALTGHLVLSTLHTNDSISAITRILDMGIEEYLISGAIVAVQAQRLVRKICNNCKVETFLEPSIYKEVKEYLPETTKFYKGEGCKNCNMVGFKGREMISEVLTISEVMARMIASGASKEELRKQADEEGFVSMFQDGINKSLEGKTTVEEIFRVARL